MSLYNSLFARLLLAAACILLSTLAHAGEWTCDRSADVDRALRFVGGIEKDEFQRFRQGFLECFPANYSGQRSVDLLSNGGSVNAALAIARALVEAGSGARPIATRVSRGSVCISACTYLFVAGRLRDVATGGSFEPHGFSSNLGARIDAAIEAATDGGSTKWEEVEVQISRMILLSSWLPALASGDPRFTWAAEWLSEFNDPRGVKRSAPIRAAQAFVKMSAAQREFVQNVDAIVAGAMPELERVAAQQAFGPLLASRSGKVAKPAAELNEKRYLSWVAGEFEAAARIYLRSIQDSRKPVLSSDFFAAVLTAQREVVDSVRATVTEQLWPYLATRADQVDVNGLITLMFSTSIIYTRPLSREEMCDLNIVNRDCAN